jgi:fluoride exporter
VTDFSWRAVSLVALGSGVGGGLRAVLLAATATRTSTTFPIGVLLVNVIGSFVFGVAVRYGVERGALTDDARRFLTAGVCGGFTTFSAFAMDVVSGIEQGRTGTVALYAALSVLLSAGALWAGMLTAAALSRAQA